MRSRERLLEHWACRIAPALYLDEFSHDAPTAAVQIAGNSRALRFQPQAGCALFVCRDGQIADEIPLAISVSPSTTVIDQGEIKSLDVEDSRSCLISPIRDHAFFCNRSSSACSATTSISSLACRRRSFTSPVVAAARCRRRDAACRPQGTPSTRNNTGARQCLRAGIVWRRCARRAKSRMAGARDQSSQHHPFSIHGPRRGGPGARQPRRLCANAALGESRGAQYTRTHAAHKEREDTATSDSDGDTI